MIKHDIGQEFEIPPSLEEANFDLVPILKRVQQTVATKRHEVANETTSFEEGLTRLPDLWRYSLLECGLQNYALKYPAPVYEALVWLGHEKLALDLIERLTLPKEKSELLFVVATAMGERGNSEGIALLNKAGEIAAQIEYAHDRTQQLTEIALALYEVGEDQASTDFMHQAYRAAIVDNEDNGQSLSFRAVADGFSKLNNKLMALQALIDVDKAGSSWYEPGEIDNLCRAAEVLARFDEQEQALININKAVTIARETVSHFDTSEQLARISRTLVVMAEKELANDLIKEAITNLPTKKHRLWDTLRELFTVSDMIGKREEILALLKTTRNWKDISDLVWLIKRYLISNKQFELAQLVFEQAKTLIQRPNQSCSAHQLIEVAIQFNDLETALSIAERLDFIKYPLLKVESLAHLIAGLAKVGKHKQALEWLNKLETVTQLRLSEYGIPSLILLSSRLGTLKEWRLKVAALYDKNARYNHELERLMGGWLSESELRNELETITRLSEVIGTQDWRAICEALYKTYDDELIEHILSQIVDTLRQKADLTELDQFITTQSSHDKYKSALYVLIALVRVGEYEQAYSLLKNIDRGWLRNEAYYKLGVSLAKNGQAKKALPFLLRAFVKLFTHQYTFEQVQEVTGCLCKLGIKQTLLSRLNKLITKTRQYPIKALPRIAIALATVGETTQATALLLKLENVIVQTEFNPAEETYSHNLNWHYKQQAENLADLAYTWLTVNGDITKAKELLDKAFLVASAITHEGEKAEALTKIVQRATTVEPSYALKLVKQAWLQADTLELMIKLLPISVPLWAYRPELEDKLAEVLTEVDHYFNNVT